MIAKSNMPDNSMQFGEALTQPITIMRARDKSKIKDNDEPKGQKVQTAPEELSYFNLDGVRTCAKGSKH